MCVRLCVCGGVQWECKCKANKPITAAIINGWERERCKAEERTKRDAEERRRGADYAYQSMGWLLTIRDTVLRLDTAIVASRLDSRSHKLPPLTSAGGTTPVRGGLEKLSPHPRTPIAANLAHLKSSTG